MLPLIIIVGPTGVGKSALGLALAQKIGGEIISGDSVQVYRKLDIGSAKPSAAERALVPHHLIDSMDLVESFTAANFKELAVSMIADIRSRGRKPIVVGGTGLYIRSLLDPYDFLQRGAEDIRAKWQEFGRIHGNEALYRELTARDRETAGKLHPNDVLRIVRALEISELTGTPASKLQRFPHDQYQALDPSVIYTGLTATRQTIYERIDRRCTAMLEQGLIEETKALLDEGYASSLKPLQSIGYRHAVWFLKGLATKNETLRLLKRDTRHFAKRQLTWFRRDPRIRWYDIETGLETVCKEIVKACMDY